MGLARNRKSGAVKLGVFVLFFLTAAWASFHFARESKPLPSVTVGRGGNPVYVLMYLAEHHGLFAAQGVHVDVQDFPTGRDALAAAIEGKVDLATSYQTPVLLRSIEGHPLRIISSLHTASQNTAIVARSDRGIRTPADLAGKKIGLAFDTSAELFFALLLKSNGVPLNRVAPVNYSTRDLPEALKTGAVDAVCTWQPNVYNAQTALPTGATVTFHSENYTEMSLLVGMQDDLEAKREGVVRLLRALAQAEELLHHDPTGAFNVVEKFFPTQSAPALRAGWSGVEPALKLDNLLLLTLEQEADLFRQQGRVQASNTQIRQMIDTSYLTHALPEAVTLLELPMKTAGRHP